MRRGALCVLSRFTEGAGGFTKTGDKKEKSVMFSSEVLGMGITLFTVLGLLCLITGNSVFFDLGEAVQKFFLGVFGYLAFPILGLLLYVGIKMVIGFRIGNQTARKIVGTSLLLAMFVCLIAHTALTASALSTDFGKYIDYCYNSGMNMSGTSLGGVAAGLICYPVAKIMSLPGSFVFYSLALAVLVVYFFKERIKKAVEKKQARSGESGKDAQAVQNAANVAVGGVNSANGGYNNAVNSGLNNSNGGYGAVNNGLNNGMNGAYNGGYNGGMIGGMNADAQGMQQAGRSDFALGRAVNVNYAPGVEPVRDYAADAQNINAQTMRKIVSEGGEFELKTRKELRGGTERASNLQVLFGDGVAFDNASEKDKNKFVPSHSYSESYDEDMESKRDYIRRPRKLDPTEFSAGAAVALDRTVSRRDTDKTFALDENVDSSAPESRTYVIGGETSQRVKPPHDGKTFLNFYHDESLGANRMQDETHGQERDFSLRGDESMGFTADGRMNETPLDVGRTRDGSVVSNDFSSTLERGGADEALRKTRGEQFGVSDAPIKGDSADGAQTPESIFSSGEDKNNDKKSNLTNVFGQTVSDSRVFDALRSVRGTEDQAAERASVSGGNYSENTGAQMDNMSQTGSSGADRSAADRNSSIINSANRNSSDISSSDINSINRGSSERTGMRADANADIKGSASGAVKTPVNSRQITMDSLDEKNKLKNPIDEMPINLKFNFPPLDLLADYKPDEAALRENRNEQLARQQTIVSILKTANIEATVADVKFGPTLTRFELTIPPTTSIKRVLEKYDDLNLWLAAKGKIRIIAPITGTNRIGIEVPNATAMTVGLKPLVSSPEFVKAKKSSLSFCLGEDLVGNPVMLDLSKMPHLLVAGATGTGKSVFLNAMLVSLMYKYTPEELRIIIVDPKIVEFALFMGLPHLMFNEVFTDTQKACAMLDWAVTEMDRRYKVLRSVLVKTVDEYNVYISEKRGRKIPKILILIDEFADLMSTAKDKRLLEERIGRLAQKARAAGIHLVMATQRPSVDIMEGSIKTNFTSRIAFKMASPTDAQVILGEAGAEKLLGRGDVLYRTSSMMCAERGQGALIETVEIERITRYIKQNNKCYYDELALEEIAKNGVKEEAAATDVPLPDMESVSVKNDDEIIKQALRIAINTKNVSISMLQRKLGLGYPKAGKIIDCLVDKKYISEPLDNKTRQVFITKEQFEQIYGEPLND